MFHWALGKTYGNESGEASKCPICSRVREIEAEQLDQILQRTRGWIRYTLSSSHQSQEKCDGLYSK